MLATSGKVALYTLDSDRPSKLSMLARFVASLQLLSLHAYEM
jgi:hypothetical protein